MFNNFKKIILLGYVVLFVGGLSACQTPLHSNSGTTTTVIMVRHAERTSFGFELTERGYENAQALVGAIGGMKIDAIYSPDLVRNLDTVRPLADHLGIKIKTVSDEPIEDDIVFTFVQEHAGQTVLWVGNTTNLPGIYNLLGGKGEPPVKYGDLFIVSVTDKGTTKVVKKTWGNNK